MKLFLVGNLLCNSDGRLPVCVKILPWDQRYVKEEMAGEKLHNVVVNARDRITPHEPHLQSRF
jgi:hypothetical protein